MAPVRTAGVADGSLEAQPHRRFAPPSSVPDDAPYWTTHNGAALDLLLFKGGRRVGIECNRADAPTLTPSMRIALADLKLDELRVVYPGAKRYAPAKKIEVVPLSQLRRAKASSWREASGVARKHQLPVPGEIYPSNLGRAAVFQHGGCIRRFPLELRPFVLGLRRS
ncbi:MAG: hypothetical protein SFV15_18530 [Polyangiaceae bacterium]|nr:hypothetical protein [Polyangiaceae bacterium]